MNTTTSLDWQTADREAKEAAERASSLRQRLESGDLSVTAGEIQKAAAEADYLASRAAGVKAAEKRERIEQADRAGRKLHAEILASAERNTAAIVAEVSELADRVRKVVAAVETPCSPVSGPGPP